MPRTITLWRTWEVDDMVVTDQFHTTEKRARELAMMPAQEETGMRSIVAAGRNLWDVLAGDGELIGGIQRVEIEMTKRGVARALNHLPHRIDDEEA